MTDYAVGVFLLLGLVAAVALVLSCSWRPREPGASRLEPAEWDFNPPDFTINSRLVCDGPVRREVDLDPTGAPVGGRDRSPPPTNGGL